MAPATRLHGGGLDEDAVVLGDLVAEGAGQQLVGELADQERAGPRARPRPP